MIFYYLHSTNFIYSRIQNMRGILFVPSFDIMCEGWLIYRRTVSTALPENLFVFCVPGGKIFEMLNLSVFIFFFSFLTKTRWWKWRKKSSGIIRDGSFFICLKHSLKCDVWCGLLIWVNQMASSERDRREASLKIKNSCKVDTTTWKFTLIFTRDIKGCHLDVVTIPAFSKITFVFQNIIYHVSDGS